MLKTIGCPPQETIVMTLIKDRDRRQVESKFRGLTRPVSLLLFSQDFECEYCSVTRELLEELTAMSDKLSLSVKDFVADATLAARYGVDKIPATLVLDGDRDTGIRFYGVPAGYEFSSLLECIMDVGRGDLQVPEDVAGLLAKVDQPVHMQVMVTPT
jgi:glutaredoxin-like protein